MMTVRILTEQKEKMVSHELRESEIQSKNSIKGRLSATLAYASDDLEYVYEL